MIDYNIAMNFISWAIAIFMVQGYLYLKTCEWMLKTDREDITDMHRMGADRLIQEYNESNILHRMIFVLNHGARVTAFMFKRNNKGE